MQAPNAYRPQDIRNIVLLGHGGSGKTTLAEALLHKAGTITRMGSVEQASTTSDFEPEAKAQGHSTNSTLLFATYQGREINIIDTPGHPDFVGMALSVLPAVETAVIVVDATRGIELNTRRLFHAAGEQGLARMVVINKMEEYAAGLPALVDQLKAAFGAELHCINLPTKKGTDVIDCFDADDQANPGQADFGSVSAVHKEMLESAVEVDDAQLEKYLAGEKLELSELRQSFVRAMSQGRVVPVLFTSAKNEVGIDDLLHILVEESPSPLTGRPRRLRKGDGELVEVPCDAEKPLLAHVFKVTSDPYVGKLAMLRILQGKLDGATPFVCGADKKPRKAGQVLKVEGRDHPAMEAMAHAGDLVALAKVEDIHVNQVLHAPGLAEDWSPVRPKLPVPMVSLAVQAKNKADDVKLASALQRIAEEDPTVRAEQDSRTREIILSGLGELHLRTTLERFRNRFHIDVEAKPPAIAYRETISVKAEGHYRLKKQTGGAGQFAEVFLRVEPLARGEGFAFDSEVFGGSIPTQYIPSVEKGAHDAMEAGPLAGFPVRDVKVIATDGKSHPVDSKDIAFRTAGKRAVKDALSRGRPVILEPVMSMEITVPEAHLGTVTGDLKQMRGRVMGVDSGATGTTVVHALVPLAEIGSYGDQLRGATGGQGSFVMEPSHYDIVPQHIQQKLAAAFKPKDDNDKD